MKMYETSFTRSRLLALLNISSFVYVCMHVVLECLAKSVHTSVAVGYLSSSSWSPSLFATCHLVKRGYLAPVASTTPTQNCITSWC